MNNPTRRWGALGSVAVAVAGLTTALLVNAPAGATPVTPSAVDRARSAAATLVAQHAAVLQASADDAFQPQAVQSSARAAVRAVRAHLRGLPVVGGDFVVVTDSAGQVLTTSVAQTPPGAACARSRPTVTKAPPRWPRARPCCRRSPAPRRPDLVVLQRAQLGPGLGDHRRRRPRAATASRLTVYVDATTGKVLIDQEHVMRGHRQLRLGRQRSPSPPRTPGSTYSMTDPNALDPEVPGRRRPTRRSPAPTTPGATATRPTARPAASTRCTSRTRSADAVGLARPQRHGRLRRLGGRSGSA